MRYFLFDYKTDAHLIESLLDSAALAHGHLNKKSVEWFTWKFRQNPFGESILVCAEHNEQIIGCVAYGIQPFWLYEKKMKGVFSFETFVHPSYQGKGVFGNLLKLGEEESKNRGIDIMLNFPNANSLKGFLNNGWKKLENPEYWIKGKDLFTILSSIRDLKKTFKPSNPNLSQLATPIPFMQRLGTKYLTSSITSEYLKWRFFSFSISEYHIIDNQEFYAILRIGYRGKVKEAQILYINLASNKFCMKSFLKACKAKVEYDLISFPISKHNPLRPMIKKSLFIKVPNKTNICFKILNDKIEENDVRRLNLSGINYHTY